MNNKINRKKLGQLAEAQLKEAKRSWSASDWVDYYLQNDEATDADTFWKEDDTEFENLLNNGQNNEI